MVKIKIHTKDTTKAPTVQLRPYDEPKPSAYLLQVTMRAGGGQATWVEDEADALEFLQGLGPAWELARLCPDPNHAVKAWRFDRESGRIYEVPVEE